MLPPDGKEAKDIEFGLGLQRLAFQHPQITVSFLATFCFGRNFETISILFSPGSGTDAQTAFHTNPRSFS